MATITKLDDTTVQIIDEDKVTRTYGNDELVDLIDSTKRERQSYIAQRNSRLAKTTGAFALKIDPLTADIAEFEEALTVFDKN